MVSTVRQLAVPDGEAAAEVDCDFSAALVLRGAIAELVDDYERRQDTGVQAAAAEPGPDAGSPPAKGFRTPVAVSRRSVHRWTIRSDGSAVPVGGELDVAIRR